MRRTACSIPRKIALLTIECPMLSSSMSRMAATGCTLSYVSPCPAWTARPRARAWAAARRSARSAERRDVGVLNLAAVLAEVHGDAVGAALLGRRGGAYRVGFVGAARFAYRRDVINVDVQPHAVLPSVHSAHTRGIVRETATDP